MWSKFSESGALAAEQKIIGVHISFAEFSLDYDYDYIKAFLDALASLDFTLVSKWVSHSFKLKSI